MINRDTQLSPAKQALLQIRELKRQLAAARHTPTTDIAIVSTACRFPQSAETPETYWEMLRAGQSQISEIPGDRWDLEAFYDEDSQVPGKMYARWGAFLNRVDSFDAEFFGISPREATWVDPQQRLLMETSWEALERAGWTDSSLSRKTGVFIGWMHNDYQNEASDSFLNLNPYIATGAAGSFLSGRLAYYLGLEGPSLAIDTACSSSLVALHLACLSLSSGECDAALVGGVNVIVSPTTNILTCKLQALSPHGHSLAFDARADGYVRGEGCGVVAIKRLEDAERAGDPILAVIRGTAVGHNGMSNGLTVPNSQAQERVIREALQRARVSPSEIDYLEAHGTGTSLGDPIELHAAAAALGENRDASRPLYVGSVKTNIGHLEAAAGMAGLIKVVTSLQHGQIPQHLNFEQPNPHISWDKIPVQVLTNPLEWNADQTRLAGVSAFGMSGTNAHVVIAGYSHRSASNAAPISRNGSATIAASATTNGHSKNGDSQPASRSPQLITLSGRNEDALYQQIRQTIPWLENKSSDEFIDAAYTLSAGRTHFDHRLALVADSAEQAAQRLRDASRSETAEHVFVGHAAKFPRVCWQFTGQGAQYLQMAESLYRENEQFRKAIDECEQWSQELRGESLLQVMFGDEAALNDTRWTQPAIFAVQKGLSEVLSRWGLKPDYVMGHSVGQYAAACTAGVMTWEQGFFLICERGRCISELERAGVMYAIFAPADQVDDAIAAHPEVSLAARNGTHQVISGKTTPVERLAAEFTERGIRCKQLQTSHAFHSALMDPALNPFEKQAAQVAYKQAAIPLVCNVTGNILPADFEFTPAYWANHIREAVRYSDGLQALQSEGCEILLELGPQGVLTNMARAVWSGEPASLISCLQKKTEDTTTLLEAIGQLYVHGVKPDFRQLYSEKRRILVGPTYPFQRRRFWGPPKPKAAHATSHTAHPLLGSPYSLAGVTDEKRFESVIEPDSPAWLPDHSVMDDVIFPGAALLEMAMAAGEGQQIQNAVFEAPVQPQGRTRLQSVLKTSDGKQSFEVYAAAEGEQAPWRRHFRCELAAASSPSSTVDLVSLKQQFSESIDPTEFYETLAGIGLNYGAAFRVIESLATSETGVLAQLQLRGDVRGYQLPPTLLDGALHSLAVGLLRDPDSDLFLPAGVGELNSSAALTDELWCHAEWTQPTGDERFADLTLYNADGVSLLEIRDLKVKRLSRAALRKIRKDQPTRLLYDIRWQDYRLPDNSLAPKTWLVVAASEQAGAPSVTEADALGMLLTQRGHRAVHVDLAGESGELVEQEGRFLIDGHDASQWTQLLTELKAADISTLDGIVWHIDSKSDQSPLAVADQHCMSVITAINAFTKAGIRGIECGFQIVTCDGVSTGADSLPVIPAHSQFWGFGRSLAAEQPTFQIRLVDQSSAVDSDSSHKAAFLADYVLNSTPENQIAIRNGQYFIPRLQRVSSDEAEQVNFPISSEGACLITGGLGMLGQETARWLAAQGAGHLVLVSRRPPNEATVATIEEIRSAGTEVTVAQADSSDREAMSALLKRFGTDLPPLKGVMHAAGVLQDGLIADQTSERFEKVLSPKVIGAQLLHELTEPMELDFFILYSSAASVLGSPGQTNYSTANGYLDGLAQSRIQAGLPALSLNWGPWTIGMAADENIARRMELQGIVPLDVSAHQVLPHALSQGISQGLVLDVDWRRLNAASGGMSPPLLADVMPARKRSAGASSEFIKKLRALPVHERRDSLRDSIQLEFQAILGSDELPATDRPVIEFGLDSLMAVEFSSRLQSLVGEEYAIAPTMLFDYPTIDAITGYVLEQLGDDETPSPAAEVAKGTAPTAAEQSSAPRVLERDNIALVGLSCRFPGASNAREYWQNLIDGVDAVCEIPADRWDVDRFYSKDREPGKMYCREGGFVEGIDQFAAEFFNLSWDEACWIDPQHRMLLENCWSALEDAGLPPGSLPDPAVGVFMGIMSSDYAFLPKLEDQELLEQFQGAGFSHSAGVGRISHFFGFEGPSVSVDTASSSSLVAVFQAMRALQERQCNLALAGGVNAILAPVNTLLMSNAGLLSPDGRCKSFSAAADGFGRGEGCGVVVMKREQDAIRDGDRILATLRGGAVAHNGTSGGVTMPNGPAQSRLIRAAWEDAGLPPQSAQYLEAHGTGTAYGDPMELNAAAAVLGRGRRKDNPLLVGSVKANISHLEAAGGISGLIKTVLALHHGYIPRQLHFDEPSPHIRWKRLPVRMVTDGAVWPETDERIAAVTALGLSGTNAHVVLSAKSVTTSPASVSESEIATDDKPELLLWSARTPTALKAMAGEHRDYLQNNPQLSLADVAGTLAQGRTAFEYRLALTSHSMTDLIEQLEQAGEFNLENGRFCESDSGIAGQADSNVKQTWQFEPMTTSELTFASRLYSSEPVFQEAAKSLLQSLREYQGQTKTRETPNTADEIEQVLRNASAIEELSSSGQVVLEFVCQWGLSQLLERAGATAEKVAGYGIGQYTAACLAGSLKAEDAICLIYEQARVQNSDDLDKFEAIADRYDFYPPAKTLWCSLDGEMVPVHRSPGGSYWKRFAGAKLEVTPPIRLDEDQKSGFVIRFAGNRSQHVNHAEDTTNTSKRERNVFCEQSGSPEKSLRKLLGDLFVAGCAIDPTRLSSQRNRRVSLPTYPFERKRYWITDLISKPSRAD